MKRYLAFAIVLLLMPSWLWADAVLGPAANPPQPITILSASGIPFIKASSGTMGNNGAISAMTALPRTYSNGAYLYLPANAISAGSSAGWYWFVGSSTTAGTVYNSTYTSGPPAIGTATAFSTTGPGAYTGVTTAVVGPSITLPANAMGANGQVEITSGYGFNNSAGTKTMEVLFGGSAIVSATTATTTTSGIMRHIVHNRGVATAQYTDKLRMDSSGSVLGSVAAADLAIDTTAAVTISIRLTSSGATDSVSVEHYSISVMPRS